MTWSVWNGGPSYYIRNILARYLFLGESLTSPLAGKTTHLALADSEADGTYNSWTEPSGNNYARIPITFLWSTDNNNYITNGDTVYTFPTASGTWSTNLMYVVVFDSLTTGSPILYMEFPNVGGISNISVTTGKTVRFAAWKLYWTFHGYNNDKNFGGMSWEHSKYVMRWLMNMESFPYSRTYDVALGRNLTVDGSGRFASWTECSGTGYSRQTLTASDWSITGSYNIGVHNNREILFTEAAGSAWGTISHVVLFVTGTNTVAFYITLLSPFTISASDGVAIPESNLSVSF